MPRDFGPIASDLAYLILRTTIIISIPHNVRLSSLRKIRSQIHPLNPRYEPSYSFPDALGVRAEPKDHLCAISGYYLVPRNYGHLTTPCRCFRCFLRRFAHLTAKLYSASHTCPRSLSVENYISPAAILRHILGSRSPLSSSSSSKVYFAFAITPILTVVDNDHRSRPT